MAFMQVRSENPSFSFLIKKNPSTGMQLRAMRKGTAYGWYTPGSAEAYNIYFKDADNEVSFKQDQQEQFEYLNVSRYNTPQFPLQAISAFLAEPLKGNLAGDTGGYVHICHINLIHIEQPRAVDWFAKHMPDIQFTAVHQAHKSYVLTISTARSLHDLLHVVSVLCLFLSIQGKEYFDASDEVLEKYMRSLNAIDAPFYIRSLFARYMLNSRNRFKRYAAAVERTEKYAIQLAYGPTGLQRRNFVAGELAFRNPIVDVGCGEGYYALAWAGKMEGSYYAIDVDPECREIVRRKAEQKQLESIALYESLDAFIQQYNGELVDVLLCEVIEHMSEIEAAALIRQVCTGLAFETFVITTPNADFNPYYELSGFRHPDHKWEMGLEQFRQWLTRVLADEEWVAAGLGLEVRFVGIGDAVNGVHTTQGAIIRRKGRGV